MKRALQKGFTLIELVVVIVILGILSAIAVPNFLNVANDARNAVAQGACGAYASAGVILFASQKTASTAAQIVAQVIAPSVTFTSGSCATVTATHTAAGSTAQICPTLPAAICTP